MRAAILHNNTLDYPADVIMRLLERHTPDAVAIMIATRRVFVAEEGARLVGTAALEGHVVRAVFVAVEQQRRGVARALVRHLEGLVQAAATETLALQSSISAHGFYETLGYRTQAFRFHPEGSTYRMIKSLPPADVTSRR